MEGDRRQGKGRGLDLHTGCCPIEAGQQWHVVCVCLERDLASREMGHVLVALRASGEEVEQDMRHL